MEIKPENIPQANPETYKVYQLVSYFVEKHGYKTIMIKGPVKPYEMWMFNDENPDYQVIRITLDNTFNIRNDRERTELCIGSILSYIKLEQGLFLDIHVCKDEIVNQPVFDTICIDLDYYDGVDLQDVFPGLETVIKKPVNRAKETFNLINSISKSSARNEKAAFRKRVVSNYITYGVIGICFAVFVAQLLLKLMHDNTVVLIFLGADYKMMTLGLGQYFRLITSGFVHGSAIHLIMNMISFQFISEYVEKTYGHLNTAIALLFSIIVGSLTNGILTNNIIVCGLSGGIYGLMFIYLYDAVKDRRINVNSFINILSINIVMNFMSNVSWQSHLGGFIGGMIMYMIISNKNNQRIPFILIAVLTIGVLTYKYLNINIIDPIYSGTDIKYLQMLEDFGFGNYAKKLLQRFLKAYTAFK